jgi:hypothetical protein
MPWDLERFTPGELAALRRAKQERRAFSGDNGP